MRVLRGVLVGIFTAIGILGLFSSELFAQHFVYVANNLEWINPNSVSAYAVNGNGVLTEIPGSPFMTGGLGGVNGYAPRTITLCAAKNLLFVGNAESDDISVFSINPETGVLAPIAGSPFPVGEDIWDFTLCLTPDNEFLMVGNAAAYDIIVLKIGTDGSLVAVSSFALPFGERPSGMKVTPDGKFLAIAQPGWGTDENPLAIGSVHMFNIAPDGALYEVDGSPYQSAAQEHPTDLDINCSGNLLFVSEANHTGTVVEVFAIGANGSLSPIPGSPFVSESAINSNCVFLSPDERLLFCSNQGSYEGESITVFNVAAEGTLTLVPGSPFQIGGDSAIQYLPSEMATNQDGTLLYISCYTPGEMYSSVAVFIISSDGSLTPVSGSPFRAGQSTNLVSLVAYPPKTCSTQIIPVSIDIKPGSCPNALNPRSKGDLPVAIAGTDAFDVEKLDPSTVMISCGGNATKVPAVRWSYEDVATPFDSEPCGCHQLESDGYPDLLLFFDTQALNAALGLENFGHKTNLILDLTGSLKPDEGGKLITGKDCIRISK